MNDKFAQLIVHHLVEQGVRRVCISPGSRSTPLAYALSQEPRLEKLIHFDERGTAFHAFGYAKGSKTPVVIIATSGTAVANFFPAVMDASLEDVPLIVITADRPVELRDCGANQTCDQVKIFGNFVRWYFELPCPDAVPEVIVGTTIAQAVYRSNHSPKGPVHINCLFREPLLSDEKIVPTPSTRYEVSHLTLSSLAVEHWAKKLMHSEKGVIVVGSLATSRSLKSIFTLAEHLDWPILPDILSGIRSEGMHPNVISHYEMVLKSAPPAPPDSILHFGDRLVSKPLLKWMESSAPSLNVLVADHPHRHDPTHSLTHRIQCDPTLFCEQLAPKLPRRISWLHTWKSMSQIIEGHIDEFLPADSEAGFIRYLHHHLPPHYAIFCANSMPIRDLDNLYFPRFHRGPIFGKRGSSGIDGNIATAIGIAEGCGRPTVAILGDTTALHDLNSLAQLQSSKYPVILLIINNSGGGIFSFLPVAEKKEFVEEYIAAAHPWQFEHAASMFHLPYTNDLHTALRHEKSCIVELKTSRAENVRHHQEFDAKIKEKIDDLSCAIR